MLLTDYYSIEELKDIRNSISDNPKIPWTKQKIFIQNQFLNITDSIKNIFKLSPLQFCKVFDYYLSNGKVKICLVCGKENYNFRMSKLEWLEGCSKQCQSILSVKKRKQYFKNNYGVINNSQLQSNKEQVSNEWKKKTQQEKEEIVKKSKNSLISRYGVSCGYQIKEVRSKAMEKAQSERSRSKRKLTFIQKYGVDNVWKNETIKERIRKTTIERYGVDYAIKNSSIFEKTQISGKKRKPYKLGNKMVSVQGYEPQCLDILLTKENILPEDIAITKSEGKPSIYYTFKGKERIFYPDFYIKSQNRIIEVKSTWTYKKDLQKNLAKQQACIDQGYSFDFYVMGKKGNLVNL